MKIRIQKVADQLRPSVLGITDNNGVSMRLCVFWNQSDVWTAEHDGDTAPTKMIGQFVRPHGCARDHGQTDQVSLQIQRHVMNAFIEKLEFNRDLSRNK